MSIRQLFVGIRGARTALWATLTCTILGAQDQKEQEAQQQQQQQQQLQAEAKMED
jgi:hypothetical protein